MILRDVGSSFENCTGGANAGIAPRTILLRSFLEFFQALTADVEIYHFGFALNENMVDTLAKFVQQVFVGKRANLEMFPTCRSPAV